MDFREDQLVKTSTNRMGRSTILTLTLQAIGGECWGFGNHPKLKAAPPAKASSRIEQCV
jgi:hypothetical protein